METNNPGSPLIETRGLTKNFGNIQVLKGITTSFAKNEVVSIIGPSGGGKSTFLRCLNLLEVP
ncbi:MAG TPA: ATP-binding cassette domain-containing protein, partial [Oscillospiraceae bacterium]|nr:ATP-binding cassette domain-containing protein [Oscillospiraceae bacterium]